MIFVIQVKHGNTIIATKHNVAREIVDNMIEDHKDFIVTSFDNAEFNILEFNANINKRVQF